MSSEEFEGSKSGELRAAVELLEAIVADRGLLCSLDEPMRRRLLEAAGRVARPTAEQRRRFSKAFRKVDRDRRRAADERLLDETGIRTLRNAPVYLTPEPSPPVLPAAPVAPAELQRARKCYVCKREFTQVHEFYDALCPPCASLNWRKRHQSADLRGRVALVTGARVKIGYQAAVKLLRAGARVLVTTRFPRDAVARYTKEVDSVDWLDRLEVHGLDLRHTPSVQSFANYVVGHVPRLDFVLHNACQTVRRPAGFYKHLLDRETEPFKLLSGTHQSPIEAFVARCNTGAAHDASGLSQMALLPEDAHGDRFFPIQQLDADLQQVDTREANSWRMSLADVPTAELLEVQLVNAIAPFVLNARLKALMARHQTGDRHIVNVSAVEGQFYRKHKTDKHPHTNMAKAALNMMTRTSAADYVEVGVHMNSVDTGWVTDEDPLALAERKRSVHGFHPPLDIVDGAARICDPIFSGFLTGEHRWGLFFKDYAPAPW